MSEPLSTRLKRWLLCRCFNYHAGNLVTREGALYLKCRRCGKLAHTRKLDPDRWNFYHRNSDDE